ncbi:L,D-transpeptidase family protein [Curtobacterium flaccumfaciens pv. flaccumfaciens]|uniref:L,D-transpeptidase family protein n=1 Tax=Curtobacterium flaccumfaciens TaxID=2035 RepID=UPI00217E8594|nr:L,D-transpeptidase family protein [Curtobacterium flaccumfaciens]MCS6568696.1 L,D-transpeptidase family protein [Curtobacterium flaccumfaciens pv. flaccumfaciens]
MPILPTEPRRRATVIAAAVAVVCAGAVAFVALGPLSAAPAPTPTRSVAAPTPTPTTTPEPTRSAAPVDAVDAPASTTVAAVTGASVPVSASAGGKATQTLENPQASGAPLVFRVVDQQDGWAEVQLAQRPNGSTGWVPTSAVTLTEDPYAIVVTRSTKTLDLYKDGKVVDSYPVATGTGGTPSPTGRFALTELLAPTNEGYGPYAYGTTAFSDVLNSFGGGPGQIGLHGTEDTSSIGTAASHGCIRLHNADITALAERLPLGTPFQVR